MPTTTALLQAEHVAEVRRASRGTAAARSSRGCRRRWSCRGRAAAPRWLRARWVSGGRHGGQCGSSQRPAINTMSRLSTMRETNIVVDGGVPLDLNLLRLFDAVYRTRSVSRAALALGLSQPAASQGLTRHAAGAARRAVRARRRRRAPDAARRAPGRRGAAGAAPAARGAVRTLGLRSHAQRDDAAPAPVGHRRGALPARTAGRACTGRRRTPACRARRCRTARSPPRSTAPCSTSRSATCRACRARARSNCCATATRCWCARATRCCARGVRGPRLRDLNKLEVVAVRSHAETLRIVQQLGLGAAPGLGALPGAAGDRACDRPRRRDAARDRTGLSPPAAASRSSRPVCRAASSPSRCTGASGWRRRRAPLDAPAADRPVPRQGCAAALVMKLLRSGCTLARFVVTPGGRK